MPWTLRICRKCYAYVQGFPCSACGDPGDTRERRLRESPGELEEITARKPTREPSKDPAREFFDKQLDKARERGFKPGYAAALYREKFGGQWPPWAWSNAAKQEFAGDSAWQARVEKRAREREYWAEKNEEKNKTDLEPGPALEEEGGVFDGL
jgi:hypothetical protein